MRGVILILLLGLPACGGDNEHFTRLRAGTPREREDAAAYLGAHRVPGAVPHLRQALRDTVPEVRAKAVWALGMLGAGEALPDLVPFLRDGSRRLRQQAAVAIMHIEQPEAIAVLELAMRTERDPWVRSDLARAIAHLKQFVGESDIAEGTFR
ncbi:MAG: HEAT repeat domain-containing protein [Gemmatimonadota bacterium]|nr:HEAT repeat domain-containing protein [Gemmatimonadota bacterium]